MRRAVISVVLFSLTACVAIATTMPTVSTNYTVWRPSAPNAGDDVSYGLRTVMDAWGYNGDIYAETTYGTVIWNGLYMEHVPPAKCTLEDFAAKLAANDALFFVASHANSSKVVAAVYDTEVAADFAKMWYESGGYSGLSVVSLPQGWGLAVDSSFVSSRCNAQIVVDMGCYNGDRDSGWWNAAHLLGHDQPELGPPELTPQISNFFWRLHFQYYPDDLSSFPENYLHSFSDADALVDTLTMHAGGDIVLGPTFIPWTRKHDERDGPGDLDVVFDTNIPCIGSYSISSFNSSVATVVENGVTGVGDLYVKLNITGAGVSALVCDSHSLYAGANPLISFNGTNGFLIQFTVDTTPMAGIEDFSVKAGTGKILVSSLEKTEALIIEGSDSAVGPYMELARQGKDDLQIGATNVSGLPPYQYYRLREEETTGNFIEHVIVEPQVEAATAGIEYDGQVGVQTLLNRMMQGEQTTSPNKLAILAPSFMANAVSDYQNFWSWYISNVDVYWIDDFWNGGNDPDVFRANEKAFIEDLISQGHDTFLLIGDASDSKEIQAPWPTEYGWEDHRLELLAGDYIPQPEKNIHPSPVYWYDPVLSQDAGVNLPYFFSDWLLLDLDGDDFPEPGLVIGRLPFSEEGQLWTYLNKITELKMYGVPDVPINTLALVGDVNHAGEFDGTHAVDVMGSHLDAIDWPVFSMLESEYGSELSRASALRTAWQDPGQMWNFVVCVASYSTRYRLGNWITMAFSLDFAPEMTHYPFMFLNSCTTGNYWWTENGGTSPRVEYLLEKSAGYSGVFAHSDGSWQEPNRSLGVAFLDIVRNNLGQSWGVSVAQSVQACKDLGPRERVNALRSVFLSDPVIVPLAFNPDPMIPTGVPGDVPMVTRLNGNYPNPFNPSTTICYEVAGESSKVNISVFDIRGARVRELVNEKQEAGGYRITWDGTDDRGQHVASGWYMCRMTVGEIVATTKMALIK